MGDRSDTFAQVAEAHQLRVEVAVYARCSCGEWAGNARPESMAEWAAHVHVAAGLAEEEDRRANEPGTSTPTVEPPAWGGVDSRPEEYTATERAFLAAAVGGYTPTPPGRLRYAVEPGGAFRYFMT